MLNAEIDHYLGSARGGARRFLSSSSTVIAVPTRRKAARGAILYTPHSTSVDSDATRGVARIQPYESVKELADVGASRWTPCPPELPRAGLIKGTLTLPNSALSSAQHEISEIPHGNCLGLSVTGLLRFILNRQFRPISDRSLPSLGGIATSAYR
jgi:hypothetical protein